MKFGTISRNGREELIAQVSGEHAVSVASTCEAGGMRSPPASMQELIDGGQEQQAQVRSHVEASPQSIERLAIADLSWLPPLPKPSKIICSVLNNKKIRSTVHMDPGAPNYIMKPRTALTGHNTDVRIEKDFLNTFGECELAAVIGKGGKHIEAEKALDHIFGYSIVNDVTSQGLKFGIDSVADIKPANIILPVQTAWRHTRGPGHERDVYYTFHTRSKGCDTFAPMGPWIVTADELPNPNEVEIRGYFDDALVVKDTTSSYSFSVEEIIADASKYFTLEPGDIFVCGTVSVATPTERFPLGLKSIDFHSVEGKFSIEIDGLGRLDNNIVHQWE